jgi:LPXTG-motif cell wall-anchored protein
MVALSLWWAVLLSACATEPTNARLLAAEPPVTTTTEVPIEVGGKVLERGPAKQFANDGSLPQTGIERTMLSTLIGLMLAAVGLCMIGTSSRLRRRGVRANDDVLRRPPRRTAVRRR